MPYQDPDPTDPNMLVGVELPGDVENIREMAYVFAEEYVRLGFEKDRIMFLFRTPFYKAAHRAYQVLGEEINQIVDECLAIWGRKR